VKDAALALSLAAHRARQENQRMIVWCNPRDQGFGRYCIRPGDGIAPRTYDAQGWRITWTIFQIVEPEAPDA
jgi:hypothetical protein